MPFLRRRVIIPNDRAVLQNPKDLHCDSHIGSFQVSNQHHYFPLTLQAPLDLLDHMIQAAKKLVQQPGPIAQPSLVLGPTRNSQLFGSSGKWARVTYPDQEHAILKIQRDPPSRHYAQVFWVFGFGCRRDQMQQHIIHLRKDISPCPTPSNPQRFH